MFFNLVDTNRFEKSIESYKNLEFMRINQLCDCLSLENYKNADKNNLNFYIKDFKEIKRDHLEFIKNFMQTTNESVYVFYFLDEEIKGQKQINFTKVILYELIY